MYVPFLSGVKMHILNLTAFAAGVTHFVESAHLVGEKHIYFSLSPVPFSLHCNPKNTFLGTSFIEYIWIGVWVVQLRLLLLVYKPYIIYLLRGSNFYYLEI